MNIIKAKQISWTLSSRQICDLELILNGGFAPLEGFLNKSDYENVLKNMRLKNGSLWPIPITLDVTENFSNSLKSEETIILKDKEGFSLASLSIEDIWVPDFEMEANLVYGTNDLLHPAVKYLTNNSNKVYVGGKVNFLKSPIHHDYLSYRHTPSQLKQIFQNKSWDKVIAFQTRNPLHKAHIEMTKKAINEIGAKLLIHPTVGPTKPGDVDHFTRVRCYQHAMKMYQKDTAYLSLIPLAMRMGGPREALWHALIRKNYGCTHLIVGRDHAGPGLDSNKKPFYHPLEAQELIIKYEPEIGLKMIPFNFMVYVPQKKSYSSINELAKDEEYESLSGTGLRNLLDDGKPIPEWFTYKEIADELKLSRPPLHKRGLTVFFTGLSGSGKSTLANGLVIKLMEEGSRPVSLLDGDIVRTNLSSELGFSKEHRSINVRRIGYVASEITKNGGIAICAPIAPYISDRTYNKDIITKYGGVYIEVYVSTSLEKCEERDVKGLYKKAREGIISEFTGISDPYEIPINPDITINSSKISPEKLVNEIYLKIVEMGYVKPKKNNT